MLDMSRLLPGPLTGHLLTRLGAAVTKCDSPIGGDYVRHLPPLQPYASATGSSSKQHGALFEALNAGKRGLGLDLRHKEAAAVVRRLACHYDVVLEGSRPGVMDKVCHSMI